jgi:hypothetical protein
MNRMNTREKSITGMAAEAAAEAHRPAAAKVVAASSGNSEKKKGIGKGKNGKVNQRRNEKTTMDKRKKKISILKG